MTPAPTPAPASGPAWPLASRGTLAEVLRRVRLLEIRTRRPVRNLLAGGYASVFRGRGVEVADLRAYVPGDDVRAIDWKVTARTGSAHVRRYVEERELTVLFLVDRSASTAFGSRVRTKGALATEVCAALAMAAIRSNDRVGAALFTDRVESYVPAAKGRRHVMRVLREMLAFQPRGAGTDLAAALDFVSRVLRRRAIVFVVSDWSADGYERALEALARRHDVIAVRVADPRERDLPSVGLVLLRDPESGEWAAVDSSDRAVREALARRADDGAAALDRSLHRRGVDLVTLRTGEDFVTPLLAFFHARANARRAR